jgi:hypothetical protein
MIAVIDFEFWLGKKVSGSLINGRAMPYCHAAKNTCPSKIKK